MSEESGLSSGDEASTIIAANASTESTMPIDDGQQVSLSANIAPPNTPGAGTSSPSSIDADAWASDPRNGDKKYYQSGDKRGQLKPSAEGSEKAKPKKPTFFSATEKPAAKSKPVEPIPSGVTPEMQSAAELALREGRARVVAGQAILMLDTINAAVSGGNYVCPKKQREETMEIFKNYALMHNFGMPPWLEVSFAAVMYTAPAFMVRPAPDKPSMAEKMKTAFFSKLLSRFFR